MKASSTSLSLSKKELIFPIGLILLIALRLLLQMILYRAGFESLTADEFSRTILAARWAQNPHTVWQGVWLPFHMYVFGAALKLKYEMVLVPKVLVTIFGILSILLMYMLTKQLFVSKRIGLISTFLLSVNPIHIWLSSTPLTMVPSTTFVLAGVLNLILYWKHNKQLNLYVGGLMFALANGFRFEPWMFSIVFSSSLIAKGIILYKQKALDNKRLYSIILGNIIPWSFPITWMVVSYIETGNPFSSMNSIQTYKLTWYGQERSYQHYFDTFLKIDPYASFLMIFALIFCISQNRQSWTIRWYVTISIVPLILFAYLHGGQIDFQVNYFRYLTFFVIIMYPAVAYLIFNGIRKITKSPIRRLFLIILTLGMISITQTQNTFQFANDPSSVGLAVGKKIRKLRLEQPEISQRPVVVELNYWEFLAIHVGANDISLIAYDREYDFERRQSVSLLETDVEAFRSCISQYKISHIIVKSNELRNIIESNLGIKPMEGINSYFFYPIPEIFYEMESSVGHPCPVSFELAY